MTEKKASIAKGSIFIGRKDELDFFEHLYSLEECSICSLKGRRRVGKTTLLAKFCEGKRHLFFRCRTTLDSNLDHIALELSEKSGITRGPFKNLESALKSVMDYCSEEKTVVIFDEYPHLAKCNKAAPSIFQHFLDQMKDLNSMIVLCGSSISAMNALQTERNPIFGRIQYRRTLDQLSFEECSELHPDMPIIDQMKLYLTVGGYPKYQIVMRENSYRECVSTHFFGRYSDLDGESEVILTSEISPRERVLAVAEAVGVGKTTMKEISDRSGYATSLCRTTLASLKQIGVIDTVKLVFMGKAKPQYTMVDGIVGFQYLVMDKIDDITSNEHPLETFDSRYDDISTYLGFRFERYCAEYIQRNYVTRSIGKWYRTIDGETEDVDIIAEVTDGKNRITLFCECKFRSKPTSYAVLDTLRRRVDIIGSSKNERYVIFSASEFSDSLVEAAEHDPRIILIDMDMLAGRKPAPKL